MAKFTSVEEYIASFPDDIQKTLQTIQKTISEVVPKGETAISYNIPVVKVDGKYLIYFSGWKKHASLYPFTEAIAKQFPETKNYNTSGKGTIQFSYDKPLPVNLIKKIAKFRLQELKEK